MITLVKLVNESKEEVFSISGSIDETVDFGEIFGKLPQKFVLNTYEIRKINSIGVKSWIRFFKNLDEHNITVFHEGLAVPLVEQLNNVQNFACGGKIRSISLPYSCESCGEYFTEVQRVEVLVNTGLKTPNTKCQKCGEASSFDDVPERYFAFLGRKP